MTCKKIFSNGFVCPKERTCPAKSPAGLAFFPLDSTLLRKALSSIKAKHEPVADIETARAFIKNYLFNVDPGIAEVFINNTMREHFGFKTADIKALPSFQKEIYR